MSVVFVDCETTGLDPDRHEIWELAYILDEEEFVHQIQVDLRTADPLALEIGQFWERFGNRLTPERGLVDEVAEDVTRAFHGRHIVGAVPSFDDAFLKRFVREWGWTPTWHYHLIDVEALAAGFILGAAPKEGSGPTRRAIATPPWDSEELSIHVGVDPGQFERHTALGDARWAKAVYEAVTG